MKRRTISIALALSIIFGSLTISDSTANAQQRQRFRMDTGFVTLGPNQVLRLTAAAENVNGETLRLNFEEVRYAQTTCSNGGVCKYSISSQTMSGPISLMPGEAASFDIPASFLGGVFVGVRGVVESNRRNVRVNASIVDSVTGETQVLVALIVP